VNIPIRGIRFKPAKLRRFIAYLIDKEEWPIRETLLSVLPRSGTTDARLIHQFAPHRWIAKMLIGKTEPYTRHEHKHMKNDDENKPADKDAPRGFSDELVDGDTLDVTDDPAKEEEEPLKPHDKPQRT
jgi:hypothetical protein